MGAMLLKKDDLAVKAAERHSREALLLTFYIILTEEKTINQSALIMYPPFPGSPTHCLTAEVQNA